MGTRWKLNLVGSAKEVVVKEGVSAGTLRGNGLPDIFAAVPEELFNRTRVGLQGP